MPLLIHGLLLSAGLGAIVAPVLAGLLGAAGMASEPWVRQWLFVVPETICEIAGYEKPSLAGLMAAWTLEFIPLGILLAVLLRIQRRRNAVERAAAFEQAVSVFHSAYDEDNEVAEEDSSPAPIRRVAPDRVAPDRDAA